jgi:NADH-quinone oxidoreductase subunit L
MPGSPSHTLDLAAMVAATLLPFASCVVILIAARNRPRLSAGLSIGSAAVSLFCSIALMALNSKMGAPIQFTTGLIASSGLNIGFGFLLDRLNLLMIVVVSSICFLVQVYSLGYMEGDSGFSRYYGFMSLFTWAMMSLSLSASLLQLYFFWELVGLSSYLLIGFWYEKFSATQAGKKAFIMTRAGDAAFFIGILVLFLHTGDLGIASLGSRAPLANLSPSFLTLCALLIFGGIVGKSAQFPLLTWLPDAMEGPTPVSALLHSATMVAAGVYLFARLFPFFSMSPVAMSVFLAIGTISMLLASTMAMVSRDIKKVWAYSTISQLGFMIMALASGGYFAGVFHLTTHAGFKALLFLCSGVFIHHFETNDVYELSRLGARRMLIPMVSMVLAAAALSGIPPLSGYFSKEAIMGSLAGLSDPVWLAAGLAGVFLTGYYSFRLIFILLFPRKAEVPSTPDHGSSSHTPPAMALPLIILASVTVVLGFFETPLKHFLEKGMIPKMVTGVHVAAWPHTAALALALAGLALAWAEFGRKGADQIGFIDRIPFLYRLFSERWYIDHFYALLVNLVVDRGISRLCYINDRKVIDGGIEGVCGATVESGRVTAILQTGMVQYRLIVIFAVLALLSLYYYY